MSNKHDLFTNTLSSQPTTSSSEAIVEFLPYSTINDVPAEIKEPLYNQDLLYDDYISIYPIICGYLNSDHDNPFIASITPPYNNYSIENATIRYYTKYGNYCYKPFNKSKKLTFKHLEHLGIIEETCTKKYEKTLNGVINESVKNPFSENQLDIQECIGDYSTVIKFIDPSSKDNVIDFKGFADRDFVELIMQTTSDFPISYTKVMDISIPIPSTNHSKGFLVSFAQDDSCYLHRISYLYESEKAYKNKEKPLMIYKIVPSEHKYEQFRYLLSNCGNYILLHPSEMELNSNGNFCFKVLSYDEVVENFPTDISEDTKKLLENPFPPELSIIATELTKRYNESLPKKEVQTSIIVQE